MVETQAYETLVTDSAASATAIGSGVLTRSDIVGKNAHGVEVSSFLDLARNNHGKAVGVVTTNRVSDATPASFTAQER